MAVVDEYDLTPLIRSDAKAALELSRQEGWNQTLVDWELVITHGNAIGLRDRQGTVVATAVTIDYGHRYSWLAMVLVKKSHRRQGLGSFIFERALENVIQRNRAAALDATPTGEGLYRRYGFRSVYKVVRLAREAIVSNPPEPELPRQRDEEWEHLFRQDVTVTGLERLPILLDISRRRSSQLLILEDSTLGIGLLRAGTQALQLGPVFADGPDQARRLIDAAFHASANHSLYVDLLERQDALFSHLKDLGFVEQRPFCRMLLSESSNEPGIPTRYVATMGPEYG